MKKIIYSILLFIIPLSFHSCDNLDLVPEDYSGSGSFWNNAGQVNSFMIGLHRDFRQNNETIFNLGEMRGGTFGVETTSLGTAPIGTNIKKNLLTKDNTGISNWANIYKYLLQVNHFIESVEQGCDFLSASERGKLLGQAYGIRAYYYFLLYRTYGGVPLETTVKVAGGSFSANDLYLERSEPEAVLQLVKDDLKRSEDHFAANAEAISKNMWSDYATLMLKAEVYLWSAKVTTGNHTATGKPDFEIAKSALQGVIGKYELMDDFSDIYAKDKKRNAEIIFSFYFDKDEATNWGDRFVYSSFLFINTAENEDGEKYGDPLDLCGGGWFGHEYKESFVKSFDITDSRRTGTFLEYYMAKDESKTFGVSMKKYLGRTVESKHYYDSDFIVYRYADAVLMMAEIENGLGNPCAKYINEIRERAYGGENYKGDVIYKEGTFAENELAILRERDKEFVGEGRRWFDLLRMQDAGKRPLVFSAEANYPLEHGKKPGAVLTLEESYKMLWPVDTGTLNGDPLLKQTPGYESVK